MANINLFLKNKKGFTLVELIIALVITGIVVTIATTMLIQAFNIVEPATRRMSASQLAEMTKREVASYLRTAVNFTHPVDDDDQKWEFTGYHPSQLDADNLVKYTITLEDSNSNNARLILSAEEINEDGDVFEEDRVLAHNIDNETEKGFKIIQKNDKNNFTIEIRVKDEEGNTASKTTSVRSRNLGL